MDAEGEEHGSQEVALLYVPFARDSLSSEQDEAVARIAQVTVPGQPWRYSPKLPQEAWSRGTALRGCCVFGAIV